jgi:uncharacterized protein
MLIGIISDVHDNLRHLDIAIKVFNKKKISILIHCGDFDMPFTLESYSDLICPIKAVLGNGDPDIQKFLYQLQNKFKNLKIELSEVFFDLTIDNRRIAVFHGNDSQLLNLLIECNLYDVICYGHTHISKIEKTNKSLMINPGSLIGVFYPKKFTPITIAIYDTQKNTAEIIDLNEYF